jgi:hypothetical protein
LPQRLDSGAILLADGALRGREGAEKMTATDAPSTPPLWSPRPASKPRAASGPQALMNQIRQHLSGHLETALHFALENMDPNVKNKILAAYARSEGGFDEERFLREFTQVVLARLQKLDWGEILQQGSKPQASVFNLSQVNPALKKVGKDIVVGAVFVETPEGRLIETLTDTKLFPKYGTTWRIGIVRAGDCAPGHVTIQFGNVDLGTNTVTVVNENRNQLSKNGLQYWRLASTAPSGCPKIKDIGVNVGLQSLFGYNDGPRNGFVMTYLLMATPSTQLMAGSAMNNTLDAIEEIAEGKQ